MKYTACLSLAAVFASAVAVAQDFSGSGQIYIVNSTDLSKASLDENIGCLDATGAFSTSNCATFTKLNTYPNTLQSSIGNCTFTDSTQPANTDNVYGSHSYAWHCRAEYVATVSDSLYTVNGLNYPFLCHGDTNCFYDVKNIPSKNITAPVWGYVWGSQQLSIPAGHTQVMWYWNRTA